MEITEVRMDQQLLRHVLISILFVSQCWSVVLTVSCNPKCTTCDTDARGNVVKVICTGVDIPTIPDSVQEMYMAEGTVSLPGIFKDYVFIGKTDLRVIQLKKYGITMVWESPFINLTNLIEVDLSFNEIPDFDKSNLAGPVALQVLDLNHNKIQRINDDAFVNQTSLKELHMSSNKVTIIPPNAFRGLTSVEHIDLSYNLLTSIDSQAFHGCPALRMVSLRGNKLVAVAPHLFQGLTHLHTVNLQRNLLVSIGQDAFVSTNITRLDLSRNRLHDVRSTMAVLKTISGEDVEVLLTANHLNTSYGPGVLSGVTVKLLDLQYNGISVFPQDTFANNQIRNLKLAHNNLMSLPSNMEAYLTAIKPNISLDHNPWQCDCGLLWFSKYLHRLSPPDLGTRLQSTLQCSGPRSVQNNLIQDTATIIEPGCRAIIVTASTSPHTSPGASITTTTATTTPPTSPGASIIMTTATTTPPTSPGASITMTTATTSHPTSPGASITMTTATPVANLAAGLGPNGAPNIPVTGTTGIMSTTSSGGVNGTQTVSVTGGNTPVGPAQVSNGPSQGKSKSAAESSNNSFPIAAAVGPLVAVCLIGGAVGWLLYRKHSRANKGRINSDQPHEPEETDYLWGKNHPVTRSLGPSKTYFNSNSLKNFYSYQP